MADEDARGSVRGELREDGATVFQQVPLGRTWRFFVPREAWQPIIRLDPQRALRGPERAGEVVRHDLRMPLHAPRLRGSLQRSDGQVLALAHVRLYCGDREGGLTDTDATGTFELPALVLPADIGGRVSLTVVHDSLPEPCLLDLPRQWAWLDGALRTDLGRQVVPVDTSLPLVAEVMVTTDDGEPVGDVRVSGEATETGQPLPKLLRTRVGDRFRFAGKQPADGLAVRVEKNGYAAARVVVPPAGSTAVVLRREAELFVPLRWPRDKSSVVMVDLDPGGLQGATKWVSSGQELVHFVHVQPGRHRLSLLSANGLLHFEANVELQPGSNVYPGPDQVLDLREHCRILACSVGPVAACQAKPRFVLVPAGSTDLGEAGTFDLECKDHLVLDFASRDLLVACEGFVPQRFVDVRTDLQIELVPRTQLRLSAADPRGSPIVRIAIARHGVADALLRRFDHHNEHGPQELGLADPVAVDYAPGTELDLTLVRRGVAGPSQRVVVGTASPQEVVLR